MSRISWRRAVAAAALCASAALLAGCGSSSTESALSPERMISFGDAFSDVGQAGGNKYTVNDGTINHWLLQLASRYGQTITPSAGGGTGFARASARILGKPDPAGADTPTLAEQIDAFLASNTFGGNDLVILNGGMADVVTEGNAFLAGAQTEAEMVARTRQAGVDLAAQAKRLVDAGAKQVVVVGTINLGITPWGQASGQDRALREASRNLNDAFLIASVDMGGNILYLDAAYYFNLAADESTIRSFGLNNSLDPVCTSTDPGPGIGLGAGKVNAVLCTPATIRPGANYNEYMFADALYTTPHLQRQFGDYAYDRIRNRW